MNGRANIGDDRKRSGFSLIEVMISLVILAVGLLAIAELHVAAIRGLSFSRHLSAATELAQMNLEYMRTLPFDDTNPETAPTDQNGNAILDSNDKSVLLDDSNAGAAALGDGIPSTWHQLKANPVNDRGTSSGPSEMTYYIRWTIERGGISGTSGGLGKTGIPGPNQILINLEVIWWEGKFKPAEASIPGMLAADWSVYLRASHAHRVRMTALRQSDL